jgi:hypothetical protein
MGHGTVAALWLAISVVMQLLQKECWHGGMTGSLNTSVQI